MTPTRPIIRYYGGKWKIADWVISFFPEHRCYVEAFGGAGSVLMKKKPARVEVYNDLSNEMVNLFRVLRDRDQAAELKRLLDLTPYSRAEWLSAYEWSDDPVEQARRTIVLATMSHNPSKVMRRKANAFKSPSSGHYRTPHQFQSYTEEIWAFTARLKEVIIECRDATKVMKQHDRDTTLHYVDPPYLGALRTDGRNLYQKEMYSDEDHESLAKCLRSLKGYVILSGYPCDQYREWYEAYGWKPFSMKAITGAATRGKSERTEVVWLNPRCADAQKQLSFKF